MVYLKKDYIDRMNALQNQINIVLAKKYEDKIDNHLTAKQVLVLELIKSGVRSTKELAVHLGISASAVSQILNKLEDKSFIKRELNKENRRETLLYLNQRAEDYFESLLKLEHEINEEVYEKLSIEDLKELVRILEKLNNIILLEE